MMRTDADVRSEVSTTELPPEPRLLTWRRATRERRAQQRQARRLIRRFGRGD